MSWSSTSPLTAARDGMWGFLLFAGAAWLAIAWSVLRLEPSGIARVAGAVILFGAITEALRALAGTRAWWLNTAMAVLFTVTGVLLLADGDGSFTTTSALIGWYLMVRGTVDIAVSTINRVADRVWGLTMVLGVLQVGLGFFAASRYSRTAEVVVLMLGALALMRGVADLVASLMLRETAPASTRPREKAAGMAGYAAGLADFAAAATVRSSRPRHRATGLLGARTAGSTTAAVARDATAGGDPATDERATADLDAMLALAGVSGAVTTAQSGGSSGHDGIVAATMFTGPHHGDGRVDGGDDRMAGPGAGTDAPTGATPLGQAPTNQASTNQAAMNQAAMGQAPTNLAVAEPVAMGGGPGHTEPPDATVGGRSGARSGSTAVPPSDDHAPDGDAATGGGLAALTARLFGRAGRDTR